jgi:hypothetical protein
MLEKKVKFGGEEEEEGRSMMKKKEKLKEGKNYLS